MHTLSHKYSSASGVLCPENMEEPHDYFLKPRDLGVRSPKLALCCCSLAAPYEPEAVKPYSIRIKCSHCCKNVYVHKYTHIHTHHLLNPNIP